MNVPEHNRMAWDRQVAAENPWTVPVSPAVIAAARRDEWSIVLTPRKPVPRDWFGYLVGARVLCLASGGGQQAPVLAAAGAKVTVLDNSPAQLGQDRSVAEREGLTLDLQLGEMTDLSRFADGAFDLIFHPVANIFIPDVNPLWRECFRVLKKGGRLLAGFTQPVVYLFEADAKLEGKGELVVRHAIPYGDTTSLPPEKLKQLLDESSALEFGHTLEAQIGGQLAAGFVITSFYEDRYDHHLDQFIATQAATLAIKRAE